MFTVNKITVELKENIILFTVNKANCQIIQHLYVQIFHTCISLAIGTFSVRYKGMSIVFLFLMFPRHMMYVII